MSLGGTTERIALFCGKADAAKTGGFFGIADEDEDIRVHGINLDEALSLLKKGKIISASAIIALQWLALNRDYVRTLWLTKQQALKS